ncbi:hypothetical protein LCGC14_2423350 [marine sediment metagenome]|uniref:Uncharacterized protein n=1 Tax=marine sediment metagenome TaxID=412755 RepID=A0A0F9CB60_9ZZZZ
MNWNGSKAQEYAIKLCPSGIDQDLNNFLFDIYNDTEILGGELFSRQAIALAIHTFRLVKGE